MDCGLWCWCLAATIAGCAAKTNALPPGTADADKFLFDRGTEAAKEKKWLDSREYFRNLVDNYPQSPFRPDAKLALGDTYISDGGTENLLLAANEFREFLTFYPTHRARRLRAAAAGARRTPTRCWRRSAIRRRRSDAIKEIEIFLQRFPNSQLMPEARKMEREAKDRLSEANYRVGFFYFRIKWYTGAIDRFKDVLEDRPGLFTQPRRGLLPPGRIAVSAVRADAEASKDKRAEALPYYERLVKEFEKSEYLAAAQKRIAELKNPS